jgi:CobQ-like glutamine amidotransferase family enzyme
MIQLATFMPEYFNNNGDQGNIEVLARQLEWRGVQCSVSSTDLSDSEFLLVGDGSRAVMREFESELSGITELIQQRLETGKATLLVGSAHEYFCSKLTGLPKLKTVARVSEFRKVSAGGQTVFGYRNTDKDVDLFIKKAFVSTTLFGPVLANNQDLLNLMLSDMGISEELPEQYQSRLDAVAEAIQSKA